MRVHRCARAKLSGQLTTPIHVLSTLYLQTSRPKRPIADRDAMYDTQQAEIQKPVVAKAKTSQSGTAKAARSVVQQSAALPKGNAATHAHHAVADVEDPADNADYDNEGLPVEARAELRRQRNRESAALSRERQRLRTQQLEETVKSLQDR